MAGPLGNSEFFFPSNFDVSRDEGNMEIGGKQNSLLPNGNIEKTLFPSASVTKC